MHHLNAKTIHYDAPLDQKIAKASAFLPQVRVFIFDVEKRPTRIMALINPNARFFHWWENTARFEDHRKMWLEMSTFVMWRALNKFWSAVSDQRVFLASSFLKKWSQTVIRMESGSAVFWTGAQENVIHFNVLIDSSYRIAATKTLQLSSTYPSQPLTIVSEIVAVLSPINLQ